MSTFTISGPQIRLWCLIRGKNSAFYVNIGSDNFIIDLKKTIKVEKQTDFFNIDADNLVLWRVKIDQDQIRAVSIDDMLNDESILEISGLTVGEVFKDTEGNSIRVIVERPFTPVSHNNI